MVIALGFLNHQQYVLTDAVKYEYAAYFMTYTCVLGHTCIALQMYIYIYVYIHCFLGCPYLAFMWQNDLQYQQPSQFFAWWLGEKKKTHFPTSLAWVLKTTPKTNSNTSLSTAIAPGRCLKWLWKKCQHEDVFFDIQESDVFCTIFKAVYRVEKYTGRT